jgi:hypothetical protein
MVTKLTYSALECLLLMFRLSYELMQIFTPGLFTETLRYRHVKYVYQIFFTSVLEFTALSPVIGNTYTSVT